MATAAARLTLDNVEHVSLEEECVGKPSFGRAVFGRELLNEEAVSLRLGATKGDGEFKSER